MKKLFIIIILFFIFTPKTFGADFYFNHKEEVLTDEIFNVSVLLDTKGEIINSAEVDFVFDTDKLEFAGYKDEGGVFKLWIDIPKNKDGKISFSGIIPGGVEGTYDPEFAELQKLNLVNLLFKAKASGVNNFSFIEARVLKHDGRGTELPVVLHDKTVLIKQKNLSPDEKLYDKEEIFDSVPPEEFKVYFNDSIVDSNTPPLVVFSAVDKDSGIAKYQIRQGGEWQEVTSPLEVKKSFFNRTLTVRAVDFAGNVRESSVEIPGDVSLGVFLGILLIIVGGFFASKLLKYRHGKKP